MTVDLIVFIVAGIAVVIPMLILIGEIIKGLYKARCIDKADKLRFTFNDGRVMVVDFKDPDINQIKEVLAALNGK